MLSESHPRNKQVFYGDVRTITDVDLLHDIIEAQMKHTAALKNKLNEKEIWIAAAEPIIQQQKATIDALSEGSCQMRNILKEHKKVSINRSA